MILKINVSSTNSLMKYIQGIIVDAVTVGKAAAVTKQMLSHCRNEGEFESIWQCAENLKKTMKDTVHSVIFSSMPVSIRKI